MGHKNEVFFTEAVIKAVNFLPAKCKSRRHSAIPNAYGISAKFKIYQEDWDSFAYLLSSFRVEPS